MSQKKVEQYKENKKNRKKIMKKEKRVLILEKLAGVVVCAAILFWAGFSIYKYTGSSSSTATTTTSVNIEAISDYYSSVAQ